ncbi:CAP domain-containing protein [Marinobacter zhejiangensis]|nr:CAP domain-containing protein [Marinobacter zhejiangensis]
MNSQRFLLVAITSILTACGGGGGSSDSTSVVATSQEEASTVTETSPAQPQETPRCAQTEYQKEMLARVNEARSVARSCGNTHFEPAPALTFSCEIHPAALNHSLDMATNNFFSHTGSDGLRVSHRITETGYEWSVVGENIAAGFPNVDRVMDGWLKSEGHCRNIMDPRFQHFAVARVDTNQADYPNYWTQVFATPR